MGGKTNQNQKVILSDTEKAKYLSIALGLQHIGVNVEMADRIITTYERILELGGDFRITDAVEIELLMNEKYTKKKLRR